MNILLYLVISWGFWDTFIDCLEYLITQFQVKNTFYLFSVKTWEDRELRQGPGYVECFLINYN